MAFVPALHAEQAGVLEAQRALFAETWKAAGRGDRASLQRGLDELQAYILYPYLQYEDYRLRRSRVAAPEMAGFLSQHQDWAFTPGLERAWLRSQGEQENWEALLSYAGESGDTEVRCYLAQARILTGDTAGLLPEAQKLWTVGKSQPDACDPVFSWLRKQDGITPGLAWERIRLAMEARQPRLTRYLARYLAPDDRVWADRWYQQDREGYRQLNQARNWPNNAKSRDIVNYGLRRLARQDPDRAWTVYAAIEGRFDWLDFERAGVLRELALWSAVGRSSATPNRMRAVPAEFRDGQLLEWWVRFSLLREDWGAVISVTDMMPPDLKDDARWRYWYARAQLETGGSETAVQSLAELAMEANFYGFLAADLSDLPYMICPQEPRVDEAEVANLYENPGIQRALELRQVGIANWARSEWEMAMRQQDRDGLRAAAAVATRENWPSMAIFALGNTGDLNWYEWRFPVTYIALVEANAEGRGLDPSWILGLMRSESAMAEDAISSADARGLMQVTPATAKQLARRHALDYSGRQQLLLAEDNVRFGTLYLSDLMERFAGNAVLASGAYNAGPRVVDRWLKDGYTGDPVIWIDTLPYFETRDYIPRVMAFSALYDWRLQRPVIRLSSRMPKIGSDSAPEEVRTAEVVCQIHG
jgi:soluble lytic murein transglycosylase